MSIIEYKFEQYNSLAPSQYKKEKYNLQVELLKLQEDVISNKSFDLIKSLDKLRKIHPNCYIFSIGNGKEPPLS